MSYERMQAAEVELKAQIEALQVRAAQTDVSEADEPELDIPAAGRTPTLRNPINRLHLQ